MYNKTIAKMKNRNLTKLAVILLAFVVYAPAMAAEPDEENNTEVELYDAVNRLENLRIKLENAVKYTAPVVIPDAITDNDLRKEYERLEAIKIAGEYSIAYVAPDLTLIEARTRVEKLSEVADKTLAYVAPEA